MVDNEFVREGWEFSDAGARRLSARAARAADFFTAAVLALETGWLIVFASFYVVWLLDGEPNFSFHGDPPVPKTPFYEDIPWLLALTLLVAGFLLAAFAVLRGGSHAGTIRIALSSGLLVALLANGGAALYLA
ncbi:MAG TPA: hypothetical protein VIB47_03515, partial [Dehalococcoidia bacterium]